MVAVTVYVHVLLSHVFHVQVCSVCMCYTLTAATQSSDSKLQHIMDLIRWILVGEQIMVQLNAAACAVLLLA